MRLVEAIAPPGWLFPGQDQLWPPIVRQPTIHRHERTRTANPAEGKPAGVVEPESASSKS